MNVRLNEMRQRGDVFEQPISRQIWESKYQFRIGSRPVDQTVNDTWRRVADGLASIETSSERDIWAAKFYDAMEDFKLIPGGRILAGCRTGRDVTLCNTFVMKTIPDSLSGIMDTIKDAALTMKMGGGIGFDFSTLRPHGAPVHGLGCSAAGPLPAMDICDAVCKMVVSGMGRGAMMATLRCDHPDIEAFIKAKSDPKRLRNFNLSVLITDRFMEAVRQDTSWDLTWEGQVLRTVAARDLWGSILRQTYEAAEPGFCSSTGSTRPTGSIIWKRSPRRIPAPNNRFHLMAPVRWPRSIWRDWCRPPSRRRHTLTCRSWKIWR